MVSGVWFVGQVQGRGQGLFRVDALVHVSDSEFESMCFGYVQVQCSGLLSSVQGSRSLQVLNVPFISEATNIMNQLIVTKFRKNMGKEPTGFPAAHV